MNISPEHLKELKSICDSSEGDDTGGGLYESILEWLERIKPSILMMPTPEYWAEESIRTAVESALEKIAKEGAGSQWSPRSIVECKSTNLTYDDFAGLMQEKIPDE